MIWKQVLICSLYVQGNENPLSWKWLLKGRSVIDLSIYLVLFLCPSFPVTFLADFVGKTWTLFKKFSWLLGNLHFHAAKSTMFLYSFFLYLSLLTPLPWRSRETWYRASIKITLHYKINELRSYQRIHYHILKLHVTIFICLSDDRYIST